LSAIREKRVVFLDYQSFRENQIKNYEVHPKLLKEYDNRWYLIGYVPDRRAHLTFGLERMVDVLYSEKTYSSTEPFDAMDFFRHSVGITETKSKAEKVTLRLKPIAGRLLHSQPLHPTQTKVKETSEYIEFLLHVYPSPELLAKLFSYGPDLEVISPKKIRDQFRDALTRALNNYQD
jgi:predicted DNA-binding transcriptional regulator YafY